MRLGVIRDISAAWRTSLAVAAGAAVACAVLAGALLVGDSVRGSLRALTMERLGNIELAMAGPRFVDASAADQLAAEGERAVAPAVLLQVGARHAASGARASDVTLTGVDHRFFQAYGADDPFADVERAPVDPPAVIDRTLADALGAATGDVVLLSLQRRSEAPSGSLLARDDTASVVETVRAQVAAIVDDRGLGAFGLDVGQAARANAFLPLEDLARALDRDGQANALVVAADRSANGSDGLAVDAARALGTRLEEQLDAALDLDDYGVVLRRRAGDLLVESAEYVVAPPLERALEDAAAAVDAETLPILTYLANDLRLEGEEHGVPYSTVSALDASAAGPFGGLWALGGDATAEPTTVAEEEPGPGSAGAAWTAPLADDEMLLDAWTAAQLGATPGDRVVMTYFVVGDREELREEERSFTVAGVVAMTGLAIDGELTQEYPGIAGSANMAEWDPPFPIELGRIGTDDETYWDEYRGAPKAFVSLETGRDMWRTRWGALTSMRLRPPAAADGAVTGDSAEAGSSLDALEARFTAALADELEPAAFGLAFQPVRALGLAAAAGSTDFGGLFVGLSWFVIVAAALLVALLFSLSVERRASEIGLRLAVGFGPRRVRRRLLREGLLLTALGGLVGLVGAVGYAAAMMVGLRTWWRPAVGTSRLELHVTPESLIGGFAAALVVTLVAIWWTTRRVARLPAPQLLRGSVEADRARVRGGRGWALRIAVIALATAVGALAFGVATGRFEDPLLFSIAGPLLLIGLLALFAAWIDRARVEALSSQGTAAIAKMAAVHTRRRRGRSLLAATLVALACFVVVTVAAYQTDYRDAELGLDSGAGGYGWIAEADVPLQQDLADPDGRFELNLGEEADAALADATITPFRLVPGDDASCLNLYQPTAPRLLGVPPTQRARGGFTFREALALEGEPAEDPWALLDADLGPDVVPAIGDWNSTQWILKLPLGGELEMRDERGEVFRLRLVATLETSVFQSELLIAEDRLLERFPSRAGWPYLLIDLPDALDASRAAEIATALERDLAPYGVDLVATGERLEAFHAVQNTYLATFRSLGGLGLLLGTLGLAVVLVRSVLERRGELATLRAFGFSRRALRWLVIGESATLLAVGLAVGALAALATAGGHLARHPTAAPWGGIASTLAIIFVFGLVACWIAARGALAAPLVPALKSEG
ncbi:MAG: ABC transporter permease [Acidobacteriota bacterium]